MKEDQELVRIGTHGSGSTCLIYSILTVAGKNFQSEKNKEPLGLNFRHSLIYSFFKENKNFTAEETFINLYYGRKNRYFNVDSLPKTKEEFMSLSYEVKIRVMDILILHIHINITLFSCYCSSVVWERMGCFPRSWLCFHSVSTRTAVDTR